MFEVVALTGSSRTQGQRFGEVCHWVLPTPMPELISEFEILPSDPEKLAVPLVFSALPTRYAVELEPEFCAAGKYVCTNASAFRTDPLVPIIMPEVNPGHTEIIHSQRSERNWTGAVVANPNCTSAGMTVALNAINNRYPIQRVFAVSFQAISGAGYPGVASMDINENVIPFVGGEEEKVQTEPRKVMGQIRNGRLENAAYTISAHTNRVPLTDGHLVCLSVELENRVDQRAIEDCFEYFELPAESASLPSSPRPPIRLHRKPDRPQPRLDRNDGEGMTTGVGRVRPDPLFDYKLVVLSHNTIRGAAGGSIYNAELLYNQGWLD